MCTVEPCPFSRRPVSTAASPAPFTVRRWRARCLHRHPARGTRRGRHADHRRGARERGVRPVAVVAQLCRVSLPRLSPAPDDRDRPLPDAVRGYWTRRGYGSTAGCSGASGPRRSPRTTGRWGTRCAGCARWPASRCLPRARTSTPARAGWISRPSSGTWPAGSRRPVGGCSPAWARPGPSSTATGCRASGSRTGRRSTRTPSSWPPAPRSRPCSASWAADPAQHSPAPSSARRPVDVSVRVVVNAPRVSLRPTPDGCLVVGAGWLDAELADDARTVPEERVPELLAEASAVLAGHPAPRRGRRARRAAADAGRRRAGAGPGRRDRGPARRVHPQRSDARPDRGRAGRRRDRHGHAHPLLDPFRPDRFAR